MSRVFKTDRHKHTAVSLLIVAALSAVPTFFGVALTDRDIQPVSHVDNNLAAQHEVLGASISTQQYSIKVHSVDTGAVEAGTQTRRVSVSLQLRNESNETLQVSPGLQMTLVDRTGRVYGATAQYLAPDTVIGGPLGAHDNTDMSVDFQLPTTAVPASFRFQQDATTLATEVAL